MANSVRNIAPFINENFTITSEWWKERINPITGEEQFNFYPETYVIDKDKGEEEKILWINEAWEGVKIGSDIYVNMRPRPI